MTRVGCFGRRLREQGPAQRRSLRRVAEHRAEAEVGDYRAAQRQPAAAEWSRQPRLWVIGFTSGMTADWRQYEQQICERMRTLAAGPVTITADASLPGRLSETPRQIDILVVGSMSGISDATMIVECKCWRSSVDVKDVEAFIGMLEDVGANLGMMVTTVGFSEAAKRRGVHIITDRVSFVDVAIFDEASSYWLERATEPGTYTGDYADNEPYGGFYWMVAFAPTPDDERDYDPVGEVISADDQGGWEGEKGARDLATLLIRHRTARTPNADEVDRLAAAIQAEAPAGHGFHFNTADIDSWMHGWHPTAEDL